MPQNALLAAILFATEQLLKTAPVAFLQLQQMLAEKDITVEQIKAKRKAIEQQKFEDLVPHSELPAETDAPQAPV